MEDYIIPFLIKAISMKKFMGTLIPAIVGFIIASAVVYVIKLLLNL